MEPALTQKLEIIVAEVYILIIPPDGLNFWEIFLAVGKLIPMHEFQDKNDIWLFSEGHLDFLYADLFKLKEFVKNNYPANARGAKTAIVEAPPSSKVWPNHVPT